VLVSGDVQVDGPVIDAVLFNMLLRLIVDASAWNFKYTPLTFAQFPAIAA